MRRLLPLLALAALSPLADAAGKIRTEVEPKIKAAGKEGTSKALRDYFGVERDGFTTGQAARP